MSAASTETHPDVLVVGAGPNGLTAAVLLARAGFAVHVLEATDTPGGGCRSAEFTLPGFVHDICAAVHPMGVLSPAFREIDLEKHGLAWAWSRRPLAHPLPDGTVAVLERSLDATTRALGADGARWAETIGPFVDERFIRSILQPVWWPGGGSLLGRARFGLLGLRSCERVARSRFQTPAARALFAGCAAHSVMALNRAGTAAFGLILAAAAHIIDWPCARGGSAAITGALLAALKSHGGTIETSRHVRTLANLPAARAVLFDLSPRQIAQIAVEELPEGYRARLAAYRHGPGVFKVDWALSDPIPWRNPECRDATTVHVCGDFDEILRSEAQMAGGAIPERPFVLVAQQSLIDASRAPQGRHTGWAYCHVPNGCTEDMTSRIEAQVERFAPGFRSCILARHTIGPAQLELHNPAMLGGDMAGGADDLGNFLFRPVARWNPYTTPNPRLFICSSSTPPGGGVHGMCGYHAANAVIRALKRRRL